MSQLRLNRRTVLRGAGGIAIALPWLESMGRPRAAHAAAFAKRFVAVYTPGGTVRARYTPTGSETAFTLGPILKPLEPVQNKLVVLDGIDMKSAVGEQHQAGIVAWLTGTPQSSQHRRYAAGPSIDQVIATRASVGKRRRSIEMAVRWATGKSHGLLHPINALNFEDNATFNPIPPRLDPQDIFKNLFSNLASAMPGGEPDPTLAAGLERRKSILDFLGRRYVALAARLGSEDKQKLEQHLGKIREIERGLGTLPPVTGRACQPPALIDTSDYNPRSGVNADDKGNVKDVSTDRAIPKVGKLLTDMLVMALGCEISAVGTLQWSDTEAKHTFPWLNLNQHHHYYQHDGGFKAAECEKIGVWYAQQHAYLLQQMAAVDMGGHSLLDESVVLFGSELQEPPTHRKTNMPFILAGNGGGLRTGRWLKYNAVSHNDLLVSILNLFGDQRRTFGDPKYCTGPLPGLV